MRCYYSNLNTNAQALQSGEDESLPYPRFGLADAEIIDPCPEEGEPIGYCRMIIMRKPLKKNARPRIQWVRVVMIAGAYIHPTPPVRFRRWKIVPEGSGGRPYIEPERWPQIRDAVSRRICEANEDAVKADWRQRFTEAVRSDSQEAISALLQEWEWRGWKDKEATHAD